MDNNYILIYNWLTTAGIKIARNEVKTSMFGEIPNKGPLRLIENIPDPKVATDAEIQAIAIEITSGWLEYLCCEKVNESGQSLFELAKKIKPTYDDINDMNVELDKQQSKICQYLSKFENADIQAYDSACTWGSFAHIKLYKSIGIVLDGDNKGCGISINEENQYLYNSDGDFDVNSDVRMRVIRFETIYSGFGIECFFGNFSSKDMKPIEGKNFSNYEYFTIPLNGIETTILIEKRKAMEKTNGY